MLSDFRFDLSTLIVVWVSIYLLNYLNRVLPASEPTETLCRIVKNFADMFSGMVKLKDCQLNLSDEYHVV